MGKPRNKRKYDKDFKDEEIFRLRRRLQDVEEERDILKKALAIFSKHRKRNIVLFNDMAPSLR